MTGVQSAPDRIAAEPAAERSSSSRVPTLWSGRTRGSTLPVHYAARADITPVVAACGATEPLVTSFKHAAEEFAVKRFCVQLEAIKRRFVATPGLDARRRKVEDAFMAAFYVPDTLAAALRRTGVATHASFTTRREMRRRSEVPIAGARATFEAAIMDELAAWADLVVQTEVPYDGQVVLSFRWVLTVQKPDALTRVPHRKLRLVVRGFEDTGRANVDRTSSTAFRSTFRVSLSAMATPCSIPRTVDVRTAFLQGMLLDRPTPVFIQPPPQARSPTGK